MLDPLSGLSFLNRYFKKFTFMKIYKLNPKLDSIDIALVKRGKYFKI